MARASLILGVTQAAYQPPKSPPPNFKFKPTLNTLMCCVALMGMVPTAVVVPGIVHTTVADTQLKLADWLVKP
jgi:hypothetical protein